MAQHDYLIADASGSSFLADLNNALAAIVTNNSGAAAPSATYPFMLWPDATTGLWKARSASNTDWIILGTIDAPNLGLATAASVVEASPVLGTVQNSTSGTAVTFTGIPGRAKKVTLIFNGVSTSTDAHILVQLGVGSAPTTSGYANGYSVLSTPFDGNSYSATSSTGVPVFNQAGFTSTGQIVFTNITGNTWVASGSFVTGSGTGGHFTSGGSIALSGAIGMIRATVGTGTFDLGSMNILIE
jgi:hypothetical protein